MLTESITVLIPAYNEEKVISGTIVELREYLNSLKSKGLLRSYEIIICINGSTDRTEEIAKILSKQYTEVLYFAIRQKGFGIALREGIKHASKNLITFNAADGEGLNEFIEKMIIALQDYDFVSCSRYLIKDQIRGSNFLRMFLSICFSFFIRLVFSSKLTEVGAVKGFRREWAQEIIHKCKRNDASWQLEILYYAFITDLKIKEIPIRIQIKRLSGESKVRVLREIYSFFKTTMRFAIALKLYQINKFVTNLFKDE